MFLAASSIDSPPRDASGPARSPAARLADAAPIITLVVDGDSAGRQVVERVLVDCGHEVITATDGAAAMAEVARRKLTCVLLDLRLPDMSGADLIAALIEQEPYLAILVCGDADDARSAVACLQRGAMDYLVKPVPRSELERKVVRALARRRAVIEQVSTQEWLHRETVRQEMELRRERANLERISVATLEALVNTLEAKDPYLRGHSARIADLSAMIAAELGLGDEQVELVRVAGRLHDIGKIGTREAVLAKRGPLTDEEFVHVRTHVVVGAQILAPLTHLREAIEYVRSHHERHDGQGYPDRLSGNAIPLGARIIGVAEIYDALTTARPYQEKMAPDEAVARMRDLIGTVISGDVHQALAAVVGRRGALIYLDDRETLPEDVSILGAA